MPDEAVPPCPTCGGPRVRYGKSSPRCRPCLAAKQLERYHANRDEELARMRRMREEGKGATPAYQREWRKANPSRKSMHNATWYAKNRETEIARKSAYAKNNPEIAHAINQRRQARKRDVICEHGPRCVSSEFLRTVYGATCHYCDSIATQADHSKPLARGGLHCKDNIVPACKPCNNSKHARDPEEWAAVRRLLA